MNDMHERIGEFFKNKRVQRNISQKDVAKKLGYTSSQFISNFERGLCSPPLKKIRTLINMYDLSQESVIKFLSTENERKLRMELLGKKANSMKKKARK